MSVELAAWLGLIAGIVVLLAIDLVLFGRAGREVGFREAGLWSVLWMALGLGFTAFVWLWKGGVVAGEYLAGFLIEKSLSVDNLFVFALVLAYFGVPQAQRRRVLFFGIVGAIVLRGVFILAGASLLDAFHWTIYLFGAFLVLTGIRMAQSHAAETNLAESRLIRAVQRLVPLTAGYDGARLLVREAGRRKATPLVAALVAVALFDVLFAVDSIPAIFAVTRDTFVVAAANAFSLLGLTALYFLLAGMLARFHYLNVGLAVVLVLVGGKMLVSDVYEVPVWASLAGVVSVLGISVAASLLRDRDRDRRELAAEVLP